MCCSAITFTLIDVRFPLLKRFREGVSTLDSESEWPRMRIAIADKTQSRKYAQKNTHGAEARIT